MEQLPQNSRKYLTALQKMVTIVCMDNIDRIIFHYLENLLTKSIIKNLFMTFSLDF